MKEKFMRFMHGRYGADKLNQHLMYFGIVIVVLSIFIKQPWLIFVWLLITFFTYFRMFSKNITKRYEENRKYTNFVYGITDKFKHAFKRIKDFPKYKYLKCPECGSKMRVPRRKGQISVTCPKCRHKFDAKS